MTWLYEDAVLYARLADLCEGLAYMNPEECAPNPTLQLLIDEAQGHLDRPHARPGEHGALELDGNHPS